VSAKSAKRKAYVRVYNGTKRILLSSRSEMAQSFCARLVGLLGRRAIEPDGGLWLVPSNSVHTIGMRFPIDIVLLNRNATVVEVLESVRSCSIVWPNFRAKSVLELPAETIARTATEPGDVLQIEILPAESTRQ
jgi:uncharacterized protein